MSEVNLFELAARGKYRFPSVRGDLTLEQLFDLPLVSRSTFDLDTVAKTINTELKQSAEESFVATTRNTGRTILENKLELVKLVIADKQAENEKARLRLEKTEKRRKILDALARREDEELNTASKEDLLKQLEELDS